MSGGYPEGVYGERDEDYWSAPDWAPDDTFVQAAYVRFRTSGLSIMDLAWGVPQSGARLEFDQWLLDVKKAALYEYAEATKLCDPDVLFGWDNVRHDVRDWAENL
jgi:hypothetical protein